MQPKPSQGLTPPPQVGPLPKMSYEDRREVCETYVDSCHRLGVEGSNVKLEFVVNRLDNPEPGKPPTGKFVSALRPVMPLTGMLDLYAKLGQLIALLQAQGVLKQLPQILTLPENGSIN